MSGPRKHLGIEENTVIAAAIGTIQDENLRTDIAKGVRGVLEPHGPLGRTWNDREGKYDHYRFDWANWATLCRTPNSN